MKKWKLNSWTKFPAKHLPVYQDKEELELVLSKIKKLIVINHRDCGAAKIINGKKTFDNFHETKIHKSSFAKIKKRFKNKYPNLNIETILISLNKTVEKF